MRPAFAKRIGPAVAGLIILAGVATTVAGSGTSAGDEGPVAHAPAGPVRAERPAASGSASEPVELRARAGEGERRSNMAQRQRFLRPPSSHHAFYFTRAIYSGGRGWRRASWATDFDKADLQFLIVLRRLAAIDAYPGANAVRLDDPELRKYPFLYALEVGYMSLSPPEVQGLRDYLLAGGFLVIDDFWGSAEWANFEYEIRRVLPEYTIEELSLDHPIFSAYYDVKEILQVPSINNARWDRTWERDGIVPHVRGIHDENGRLMVVINWNTDLGDAWEWAEQPDYPLKYSTYAFQMGVNFIIYAMSH